MSQRSRYSTTVYTLVDADGVVRYVGCTEVPHLRLRGHASAPTRVGRWIRSERSAGRDVRLVVQERAEGGKGYMLERFYIWGFHNLVGSRLLNKVSVPEKRVDMTALRKFHPNDVPAYLWGAA